MPDSSPLYLASSSPRRAALLQQLGVRFQVIAGDVDESLAAGEAAADYVLRLAAAKAQAGWQRLPSEQRTSVLSADTTVLIDAQILGKPSDRGAGIAMLQRLSGRTHQVLTGVALKSAAGLQQKLSHSDVTFRALDTLELNAYWDTGEPSGKAGGYAIQGFAASFVALLHGSYSGVMGLPLYETSVLLTEAGVPLWRTA